MRVSTLFVVLALCGCSSAVGAQPPADPNESHFGAEVRLERERLGETCLEIKKLGSCATTLVMGHPFHLSFGSIAPQNGFGFGPAVVTHFTPRNWRLAWSGDAVFSPGGAWRAGTYLKVFRTKIEPPQLGRPGERARPLRVTDYPVYNVYAQAISLPRLYFYGIGPDSSVDDRRAYEMSETIVGGSAAIPFSAIAAPLKLAVLLEGHARIFDVDGATAGDVPSIDGGLPDLVRQPLFVQFGEGVRIKPWFLNDRLQLGYTVMFQQFVSGESSKSFRRWTVDLGHQIPLYRTGGGPQLRDERNTPNDCSTSQSVHDCPNVTRDLWGSLNIRAIVSRSLVGANAEVPFYLQPTLGGSDINGQRRLASYDDYRFRGPNVILFQETIEHAVWGPIGALVLLEQGKVAAEKSRLDFAALRQSVGVGATVRAGGFPVLSASWHSGGPEGRHFIVTLDASLLGGGSRPSLQ